MEENAQIASLKKEIKKLKKQLTFSNSLLEQIPAHVYWMNENMVYQGCNQMQAKALNLKQTSDIKGKNAADLLPAEQSKVIEHYNQQAFKSEHAIVAEERCTFTGDKTEKVFLSAKSPFYNLTGNLAGVIGMSIDISDLKKREQRIKTAKDDLQSTLEHMIAILPGHVYWHDLKGTILGCNQLQAIAVGRKGINDLIGKSIYDFLPAEQADEISEINHNVIESQQTITAEETATFSDGTTRTYLSKKTPLRNSQHEVIGIIGVSFDISDRKNTENELEKAKVKAEKANELKNIFIANISHDIRTPLHAVIGLTELLKMKEHPKEQDETINALLQSSRSLLKLVENILNFSKIESELSVNMQAFNLGEELQKVVETATANTNTEQVKINMHIDNNIPTIIHDAIIINRILLNLLSNAIKFCDGNEIKVKATCLKKTSRQCQIQISVADKGIGIAEDQLPFIFERFFRGKPSYEGKYEGTGLGLSIVKQLADSINANISVESKENKGSTFSLTFNAKYTQPEQLKKKTQKKAIAITKAKILLVEDDKLAQKYIQTVFAEHNISISIANNGQEALTLTEKPFDLVFMDIGLPDMNGFDVAKTIKTKHPNCSIIILTAHARDTDIYQTLNDDGLDGFLQKPASTQELLSALEDCLGSTSNS